MVEVSVQPAWGASTPGWWTEYRVRLTNAGERAFSGTLHLAPAGGAAGTAGAITDHRMGVRLEPAGGRAAILTTVVEAPHGYTAEVRDTRGHLVASAAGPEPAPGYPVALLSDARLPLEERRIQLGSIEVLTTPLDQPEDLPESDLHLSGLGALAISHFDSGRLRPRQVHALEGFVRGGGSLILGGGADWRRALEPLSSSLLPMRPASTSEASLAPLEELAGLPHSGAVSPVAAGPAADGSVVLSAGPAPLIIEAPLGAGRIIELAYDPLADPIASDLRLLRIAWSAAAVRAAGSGPAVRLASQVLIPPAPDVLASFLTTGKRPSPLPAWPQAVVGAFLVLAAPAAWLLLRDLRRHGDLWWVLAAAGAVFGLAVFGIGAAARGPGLVSTELQWHRLNPGGRTEMQSFQALIATSRGSHGLRLRKGMEASTASRGSTPASADFAEDKGGSVGVGIGDTSFGEARLLMAKGELDQAAGLEARLKETAGPLFPGLARMGCGAGPAGGSLCTRRVEGTISNRGRAALDQVRVETSEGEELLVAGRIAPGASVPVSGTLTRWPIAGSGVSLGRMDRLLRTSAILTFSPAVQAVVVGMLADQVPAVQQGVRLDHPVEAVMSAPATLERSGAGAGGGGIRLVFALQDEEDSSWTDVYDLQTATGAPGGLRLGWISPPVKPYPEAQVYDWDKGTWRGIELALGLAQGGGAELGSGEARMGTVRVRIKETKPINAFWLGAGGGP